MAQPEFTSAKSESGVRATVWKNEKNGKVYFTINLDRSYKDKATGEWKKSTGFFANEDGTSQQIDDAISALTQVKAHFAGGSKSEPVDEEIRF